MFELSERMGMTRAELGARMSARELMWRKQLELVRQEERDREEERQARHARRGR